MPFIVLSENFIGAFYEGLAAFDTAFMRPVRFYAEPSVEMLMRYDCWIHTFIGIRGSVQYTQPLSDERRTSHKYLSQAPRFNFSSLTTWMFNL